MPDSSPADEAVVSSDTPLADTAAGTPAATPETPDSNGSDSSPAKAVSMIDAVQAALEPKEASPPSPKPDQAAQADPDASKADGESEDLSDDELKALSWKAQQRFKKLASNLKARDGEVTALKTKADEYDKIVSSINKAGLDNRDVDELIEIGSLLKGNKPNEALAKLVPIVNALQDMAGEILPAELQERVRLGYLTEADARALHKATVNEALTRRNAERDAAARREADEAAETQRLIASSVSAVEAWEKQTAAADPDWHLKQKEVAEQVELAIQREARKRNAPWFPNAEESVKLSKEALKTVNERLARFKPKPAEIRPSTTPGASTRSKPAPKTMLDAINNAL